MDWEELDHWRKITFITMMDERTMKFNRERSLGMYQRIKGYLDKKLKIVDIGSGTGFLVEALREYGYEVTPVDVVNSNLAKGVEPIIYDGYNLPFKDKTFGTALLITVLHHTKNPERILLEALRVSNKVIIIEEIYDFWWRKMATFVMDSLCNNEFFGHPHSNKTDSEWKGVFARMNAKLEHAEYTTFWTIFQSVMYVVRAGK